MDQELYQEIKDAWPDVVGYMDPTGERLSYITVFHDFVWPGTKQFTNGQNLTKVVRDTRNKEKRPAILLTNTGQKTIFETESWHVFVLCEKACREHWLNEEAAYSHIYKERFAGLEATLSNLSDEERLAAISQFINPRAVAHYFALDPSRLVQVVTEWQSLPEKTAELIAQIPAAETGVPDNDNLGTALSAIQIVQNTDPQLLEAVCRLAGMISPDDRRKLMTELANSADGVRDLTIVFGESIERRLDNLEAIAREYEEKIKSASETDMQDFIEKHPWILGLEYASIAGRRDMGSGKCDFLLQRHDGGYDIVEMKGPSDLPIEPATPEGNVVPPSSLQIGKTLANAVAQALNYKVLLGLGIPNKGISACQDPKIVILLGKSDTCVGLGAAVYTELKEALHNVEVINYDHVGRRALGIVNAMRKYLGQIEQEIERKATVA
ncbi:MAG: DUF4263 domain-containing protein [Armatimonadetes bacterium]|nr:DUF4263 domain-containing protein [Armatimonadota bacterium]